tara:strand:+ start:223 stop:690 length:468 start_codon:yes stop_codon:yes gene_type:complete
MTDLRKAAEMALDYIKDIRDHCACEGIDCEKKNDLVAKLEAALAQPEQEPFKPDWVSYRQGVADGAAQPEQEPVAYIDIKTVEWFLKLDRGDKAYSIRALTKKPSNECNVPLYTAPPRKEWVSLADDVVAMIEKTVVTRKQAIRMIEHHLKELNT